MELPFVKMEGAGNDYVYVDALTHAFPAERGPELARRWSDRHFGIGADGLVLLAPSTVAAVRMVMWNADGSRGAICGNGLRCVAKLAHDLGHVGRRRFPIETDAGVREAELLFADGRVVAVATEFGAVTTASLPVAVELAGQRFGYFAADAGNPHAVVFLDRHPEQFPVAEVGRAMQSLPAFPGGVNVEFVQVQGDGSLCQRTYERGSGETLACGSGAAAVAATALARGLLPGPAVRIRLRGGELTARLGERGLVITGPARTVFRGVVELPGQP